MLVTGLMTALCTAGMAGAAYYSPSLWRIRSLLNLQRRCVQSRTIVLSYDDGPSEDLTPSVLDLLAGASVKTTFFMVGNRARSYPNLVDRVVTEGHEIGNHTEKHLNAWYVGPRSARADIRAGYGSLARWVPPAAIFRPPYGKMTLATWLAVRRSGAAIGWWTIDSGDTHRRLPEAGEVANRVIDRGGGVVLMHDFDREPERARFVLGLTALLLEQAPRAGLSFRTLGEVMRLSKAPVAHVNQAAEQRTDPMVLRR